jgi:phage shock protein A
MRLQRECAVAYDSLRSNVSLTRLPDGDCTMTLIARISQLFKADFHAVLDQIEEPEQMLRQAIREMEEEVSRQDLEIRRGGQEQAELLERQRQLEESLGEFEGELDLCFKSAKDDLAKGLIRRKLETQRLIRQLATRHDSISKTLANRRLTIAEHRSTLDGFRQKAEIVSIRAANDRVPHDLENEYCGSRCTAVSDDEVEVAFLREQSARSRS